MSLMFILAIALLITGHYFKMLRWRQLIEIYEKPRRSSLLQALSLGYLINFFVPFRAGDLVRGLWAGRKFKNGVGFSLATIIVDHYVDVPIVCAIFWIIFGFNSHSNTTFKSAVTYSILFAVLVVLSLILAKCNGLIKKTIRFSCGLFNSKIELKLMLFCFSGISTFKDLYYKIDKKRLVIYSALKWSAYVLSYFCMSNYLVNLGLDWSFGDVFATLFSFGNVNSALGVASFNIAGITVSGWFMMAIYVLIPVVFLFMLSFVPQTVLAKFVAHKKDDEINEPSAILNLLPQVNENDRLNFLELYFSNTKRDYLKKYLDLNRDIHIIEDFSAGSNATTMLCMDEQKTFYRKYAFGADGEKLHEQICWLQEHENDLLLPTILKEQHGEGYCCYDMEYNAAAVGLFNFIHSNSIEKSWAIIEVALTDLSENLHNKNARPANEATVDKYISGKIWGNIEKIEAAKE
ncbi:MAG: lysylphosphatidylglycerol synthase transmembrane domain-containing protein, partial [Oscillospiraceae bacterium]